MVKEVIFVGTLPDDGTGDTLREAGIKTNSNFAEIYRALGDGASIGNVFINGEPFIKMSGSASDPVQGTYSYYVFTQSNTITFDTPVTASVLLVGGGGGGSGGFYDSVGGLSYHGNGGKGGDVVTLTDITISAGTYSITVGAGGAGGNPGQAGSYGTNSSYNGSTANGGAGGRDYTYLPWTNAGTVSDITGTSQTYGQTGVTGLTDPEDATTNSGDGGDGAQSGMYFGLPGADGIVAFKVLNDAVTSAGSFAVADGTNWDPKGTAEGTPYPVFYNGTEWVSMEGGFGALPPANEGDVIVYKSGGWTTTNVLDAQDITGGQF